MSVTSEKATGKVRRMSSIMQTPATNCSSKLCYPYPGKLRCQNDLVFSMIQRAPTILFMKCEVEIN